ncbi:hypothetical protein [Ramlibacter sp. AN1133]|uniref:hypothetical protein n=1 Tax=Ramlibacter sp. AN1133 TaxID=3133429 RepID=UPI0030C34BF3
MPKWTTLHDFITLFLARQELTDCSIVFEPYYRKGRAKRSTAELTEFTDPSSVKRLPRTRTVGDLLDLLVSLSPQVQAWTTEAGKMYMPRLYDDQGAEVRRHIVLKDLVTRPALRNEQGEARVRRILDQALRRCDRALLDKRKVHEIVTQLLAERMAA